MKQTKNKDSKHSLAVAGKLNEWRLD